MLICESPVRNATLALSPWEWTLQRVRFENGLWALDLSTLYLAHLEISYDDNSLIDFVSLLYRLAIIATKMDLILRLRVEL